MQSKVAANGQKNWRGAKKEKNKRGNLLNVASFLSPPSFCIPRGHQAENGVVAVVMGRRNRAIMGGAQTHYSDPEIFGFSREGGRAFQLGLTLVVIHVPTNDEGWLRLFAGAYLGHA